MAPVPNDQNQKQAIQLLSADDSAVPNFQSVNAAGEPTAEFAGKVKAEGLELPESLIANPEDKNLIAFINGVISERIWALITENLHSLILDSGVSGFNRAIMELSAQPEAPFKSSVKVSARSISAKTLIDNEEKSSFLQLVVLGKNKINFGNSLLTFAGTTASNITTISHGLGVQPKGIFYSAVSSPEFGKIPIFNTVSKELVNFGVNAETKVAVAGNLNFDWVAIG